MATQTPTRVASNGSVAKIGSADDAAPENAKGKKGKKGAEGKKSKKKMIIIIVVALLVVGAAYHFLLGSKPKKAGPPKPGAVVTMDDTTLNLTDGHFLKIKIALQAVVGAPATIDTSKASDLMISEFTGQSMATLSNATARNKLKSELLTKIEAAYPKDFMGIYFTEFVMQ